MQSRIETISTAGSAQAIRVLQWLFFALLLLILLPSGSVNFVSLNIVSTGFFALAAMATVLRLGSANRRPYQLSLGAALLLAAWIIVQSAGLVDNPLANPIWGEVQRLHGAAASSISVSPGDTMQGLIAATLPFAVFMTALLLFRTDRDAFSLVRAIVLTGAILCLIGIVQHLFFPQFLLFEEKKHYLDSLTAVFINRNTAATYIAMMVVFTAGLAFHHLQNGGVRNMLRLAIGAPSATRGPDAAATFFYTACLAVAFVAQMLTKSRAGIASGVAGLSVTIAILAYHGALPSPSRSFRRRTPVWKKLARSGIVLIVVVLAGAVFAGQALLRAEVQGANDLRFCYLPGLIDMARDNWLLGTGFGTFRDVFPAYRNPACGMQGVLLQAHNFYLEGWITLGLVFPVLATLVVASLAYYLVRGIRERRRYRWIPAAGLGVLVIQLAHNSVDFSIQNPGVAVVFAALTGASVVIATGRSARPETGRVQAMSELQAAAEVAA